MGGPLRYKLAMTGVRMGVRMAKFLALAPRQAGRLDPRPRIAQSARPGLPKLVAAKPRSTNVTNSESSAHHHDQPTSTIHDSRERFCRRSELSNGPQVAPPPVPEVWPRENPTPAAMAERFAKELAEVQGEVIRCATMQEARRQLAELVDQAQWTSLGAMDRPIVRDATADLPPGLVNWAAAEWQPQSHGRAFGERGGSRRAAGRHRLVPDRLRHGPRTGCSATCRRRAW